MKNKSNVEKLSDFGFLGEIRMRSGAKDVTDTSFDAKINNLSSHELVKEYCAWKLGYGDWWTEFKNLFDYLEK